jgi:hypothetical protein
MIRRRCTSAAAALALILAGCSGGGGPGPAGPGPDEPRTLQGQVLQDAQGVGAQLEQRQADMESMIP